MVVERVLGDMRKVESNVANSLAMMEKVELKMEKRKKSNNEALRDVKKIQRNITEARKKEATDQAELRTSMEDIGKRMDGDKNQMSEANKMVVRIDVKESFVCSFADVVKESESMTRNLYTQTLVSGTFCREIALAALQ